MYLSLGKKRSNSILQNFLAFVVLNSLRVGPDLHPKATTTTAVWIGGTAGDFPRARASGSLSGGRGPMVFGHGAGRVNKHPEPAKELHPMLRRESSRRRARRAVEKRVNLGLVVV